MKNKLKPVLTAILLLVAVVQWLHGIEVSPSGPYYVGDTLSFHPTNSAFGNAYSARWEFGDGAAVNVTYGMETVYHSYTKAGIYTVKVVGNFTSTAPITETMRVVVQQKVDNRYVTVSPTEPVAGQPATFRAFNFVTPDSIRWEMGDGTSYRQPKSRRGRTLRTGASRTGTARSGEIRAGNHRIPRSGVNATGSQVTHTYTTPGTYTVKVYDFSGDDDNPVTVRVTVQLPPRSITFSPILPLAGAPVQYNAVNFLSTQVDWNFGDGTTQMGGGTTATHIYNNAGTYTVTAKESNTNYAPVSIVVNVRMPNRQIEYSPKTVRVDQGIAFQAVNYLTNIIDWNFGDGTLLKGSSAAVAHRYMSSGTFSVSAKDTSIEHPPVTVSVTVLPENRYIDVQPPEVRTNETVTVTAYNFRGDYILWNFGDGIQRSGLHTEIHQYQKAGTYTITARDENGESSVNFTKTVIVRGIDDTVELKVAEIRLDNGKYYKVVPKNSKHIRAVLRMKMGGTGIVSGYWLIDGRPFEYFTEVANQGELKEIYTRTVPGIPVIDPGIHTITAVLTRPEDITVTFPVLKYFVLPHQNILETATPLDGFIAKENEIPEFSWKEPSGASRYQIAFCNNLYQVINQDTGLRWIDVGTERIYTPPKETWDLIKRNRWTYWKVRALDTNNNIVAESDVMDIKVVIATADVNLEKVTDLEGKVFAVSGEGVVNTTANDLLVKGSIRYKGDSEFLVLRVYVNNEMTDQLLFRDVQKNQIRRFETSIPNKRNDSKVYFKVLKTSSPSVVVGIANLVLKK
jgi:PKD repeat protein